MNKRKERKERPTNGELHVFAKPPTLPMCTISRVELYYGTDIQSVPAKMFRARPTLPGGR
jgi:hypothetical protein